MTRRETAEIRTPKSRTNALPRSVSKAETHTFAHKPSPPPMTPSSSISSEIRMKTSWSPAGMHPRHRIPASEKCLSATAGIRPPREILVGEEEEEESGDDCDFS